MAARAWAQCPLHPRAPPTTGPQRPPCTRAIPKRPPRGENFTGAAPVPLQEATSQAQALSHSTGTCPAPWSPGHRSGDTRPREGPQLCVQVLSTSPVVSRDSNQRTLAVACDPGTGWDTRPRVPRAPAPGVFPVPGGLPPCCFRDGGSSPLSGARPPSPKASSSGVWLPRRPAPRART